MDDIKDRLSRIEKQGVDAHVAQRVMENSFTAHQQQNDKDFEHLDECLHRSDTESKTRDEEIRADIKETRADVLWLKQFAWKAGGALLVLVPLANYFVDKYL